MDPFSIEENRQMVCKFLNDIGYEFSENEIKCVIGENRDQREIMSQVVQLLAEKIAEEKLRRKF
jgi:hypothetical protein